MSSGDGRLPHRVFVYGTLKVGEANYHHMQNKENGESHFMGHALTVSRYPLVIATTYNVPYLLHAQGLGQNIHGDVFEVDDRMFAFCDKLEEHPHKYQRERIVVRLVTETTSTDEEGESDHLVECWCYFLKKYKKELLNLPTVANYHQTEKSRYDSRETLGAACRADIYAQLGLQPPDCDEAHQST